MRDGKRVEAAGCWETVTQPAELTLAKVPAKGMAIMDGRGGVLTVDLSSADMPVLGDACRLLLPPHLPGVASAIKVRLGERCYLLRRRVHQDGTEMIDIADLFDPSEHVSLTNDLAGVVIGVLEGTRGSGAATSRV